MDAYLQTGLGIFVSVILFLVGYRQTIGAKKERVRAANDSVHRSLLRRMVLENYCPKYSDISKILEGKARGFKVTTNELMSVEQVLTALFTEVFDNDLISPSQRIEIEDRLESVFVEIESNSKDQIIEEQEEVTSNRLKITITSLMAVFASILGALASISIKLFESKPQNVEWFTSGVIVLLVSFIATALIAILKKSKEISEEPSQKSQQMVAGQFELEVAKLFENQNISYKIEPLHQTGFRPDFVIDLDGKKIVIEVKAWQRKLPLSIIKRAVNQLKTYLDLGIGEKAILVLKDSLPVNKKSLEEDRIEIYSLAEFSSILKGKRKIS